MVPGEDSTTIPIYLNLLLVLSVPFKKAPKWAPSAFRPVHSFSSIRGGIRPCFVRPGHSQMVLLKHTAGAALQSISCRYPGPFCLPLNVELLAGLVNPLALWFGLSAFRRKPCVVAGPPFRERRCDVCFGYQYGFAEGVRDLLIIVSQKRSLRTRSTAINMFALEGCSITTSPSQRNLRPVRRTADRNLNVASSSQWIFFGA